MNRELPFNDGFCMGPLFAPPIKRRLPKPRMQSTYRDRVVRSRIPAWADRKVIDSMFKKAHQMSVQLGMRFSVDHIVPLNHPLVCGLHCVENLQIISLRENIHKSNNIWPDMPEIQLDLFV